MKVFTKAYRMNRRKYAAHFIPQYWITTLKGLNLLKIAHVMDIFFLQSRI